MKLFKKFKNYQECKLCHVKLNSSITKKHLEMSHASELFKFRGKYLTSVKKVVKKLRNKNGREFKLDILEKLRDCDLVTYPEADYRLGKRKKIVKSPIQNEISTSLFSYLDLAFFQIDQLFILLLWYTFDHF